MAAWSYLSGRHCYIFANNGWTHQTHDNWSTPLKRSSIALKLNECDFLKKKTNYLRYIMCRCQLEIASPTPNSIRDLMISMTRTELCSLFGVQSLLLVGLKFCSHHLFFIVRLRKLLTEKLGYLSKEKLATLQKLLKKLISSPVLD